MSRSIASLVGVLVTFSVLAPLGTAAPWSSWIYNANTEPSSPPDRAAGFMWPDSNTAAVDKVYFDGSYDQWGSFAPPAVPALNPHATTSLKSYQTYSFHAYLGYWRDCNLDDFIGDALTGGDHYLVSPEVSSVVCPLGSLYNDGTFVQELLAIGPRANAAALGAAQTALCTNDVLCIRGHTNFVRDDFAKVWMDFNLASDQPIVANLALPFSHGTLTDSNGHFQYIDAIVFFGAASGCTDGFLDAACGLWPSKRTKHDHGAGTRRHADGNQCVADANHDSATDDVVLNAQQGIAAFTDSDPATRCSPVPDVPDPVTATARDRYNNSIQDTGTGPSGDPIIEPWEWGTRDNPDCDLKADFGVSDLNADGAIYPTEDHIWRSAVTPVANQNPADACSRKRAHQGPAAGYSNYELPDAPADLGGKVAADSPLGFSVDTYFNPNDEIGAAPSFEGCANTKGTARWTAITPTRCGAVWTSRFTFVDDTLPVALAPSAYATQTLIFTFYGDANLALRTDVGTQPAERFEAPVGLSLASAVFPGGNDLHVYGAEQCTNPAPSGWLCDRDAWIEAGALGDPAAPGYAEKVQQLAKVFDFYDVRDIDCFDTDVNGANPFSSLPPPVVQPRDCDALPVNLPSV